LNHENLDKQVSNTPKSSNLTENNKSMPISVVHSHAPSLESNSFTSENCSNSQSAPLLQPSESGLISVDHDFLLQKLNNLEENNPCYRSNTDNLFLTQTELRPSFKSFFVIYAGVCNVKFGILGELLKLLFCDSRLKRVLLSSIFEPLDNISTKTFTASSAGELLGYLFRRIAYLLRLCNISKVSGSLIEKILKEMRKNSKLVIYCKKLNRHYVQKFFAPLRSMFTVYFLARIDEKTLIHLVTSVCFYITV
jgi:hypothetical protein